MNSGEDGLTNRERTLNVKMSAMIIETAGRMGFPKVAVSLRRDERRLENRPDNKVEPRFAMMALGDSADVSAERDGYFGGIAS